MFGWLHRSVKNQFAERDEISKAVRAVRAACFGRSCLAKCVKRMTAAAPLRRLRCGGAAVVAALLLLVGSVYGEAVCIWQGDRYICSGSGSAVSVIGGGDAAAGVVTNFWGVCTNCVAMSPGYCEELKNRISEEYNMASSDADSIRESATSILSDIYTYQQDIGTFRRFGPVTGGSAAVALYPEISNYVYSVDNTQTRLAKAYIFEGSIPVSIKRVQAPSYLDGIYDYAYEVSGQYSVIQDKLTRIVSDVDTLSYHLQELSFAGEDINCEQCQAEYEPGPPPGEGSGGGSSTNSVSGNWCTYDQGEAIKELLSDIKKWEKDMLFYLGSISNSVESTYDILRRGLFTSYTHIPTEEELQTTWQELYLSGYNPNFPDYPSTNIIARIELLLAGISGVLTNVSDYASQEEFADESLDSTNVVEDTIGDFTNQFVNVMQERAQSSRSIGDALIALYQKFRTWSGTPFSTEYLINSYSVQIESGASLDVPGFSAPSESLPWANLIRVVCRSAMSVIWILMTVAVFVRFQIAFFQWCLKYVKWSVEVLQGLFV